MAVDLATLALKVEALEVDAASKKLDNLTAAGGRTEKAAGGMSTAFRALGAALATVQLANMIKESALMAARYETMGAAMVTVGNNAGYTGAQMAEYEKRLRATGIAMIESRETLTKMAASHIDLAKATDLARIAQDAAVVGNINSSEAFDRMINGIRSAEVEVLRGIGLNVNFEQSYAKLADQLGKNAKDLTEAEKLQARVNVTMAAGAGIAGTYEAAMGTAGKMLNSMKRYSDDLKVSLGEAFSPALTLLIDQQTSALKAMNQGVEEGSSVVQEWGGYFKSAVIVIEGVLQALLVKIYQTGAAISSMVNTAAGAYDALRNAPASVGDMFSAAFGDGKLSEYQTSALTRASDQWEKFFVGVKEAGSSTMTSLAGELDKVGSETEKVSNAQEQARIKAGLAARTQQELDDKKSAASKEAEASAKKARSAAEAAAKASAKEYQAILDSLEPARVAQEEYNKALAVLNKMDPTHETERYKAALEELNSTTAEAIKLEQYRNNIIGQRSDYEKQASQASMTDAEIRINNINREVLAFKEYGQRLVGLGEASQEVVDANNAAFGEKKRKEIEAMTDSAGDMGKMFEDVAKNIQGAFSDTFENVFSGATNSMSDLVADIKSMFVKMLAQLATMAIANPIIIPMIASVGSAMGMSNASIASAAGTDASTISGMNLSGLGSLFASGSLQSMGVSSMGSVSSFAYDIGFDSLGSLAADASDFLAYTSAGLADGLVAGVGSLAMSLLSGQGLTAQTGLQASGAALGASFGGPVGAVLGGMLGSVVGGMFGTGEDTFGPQYMANDVGTNYSLTAGMKPTTKQYTGGDTDSQIAKVYAEQMRSIQVAFDAQVTALAESLPDEVSSAMLKSLSETNLKQILNKVSGQEINVADAESWLKGVATAYSEGLITELGKAYGNALSSFIAANGAEGIVGDSAAWGMLTEAVKQNITDSFQSAAATIAGGDIETGLSTINSVTNAIAAIESAMAPITEIIETAGLTEYEKSIRAINIQFDNYADALKAAGVDMGLYTDLETARAIALADAAEAAAEAEDSIWRMSDSMQYLADRVSKAEADLRAAFSAEQDTLDDAYDADVAALNAQHEAALDGLNAQLSVVQDSVSKLSSLTNTLRSALKSMNLETEAFKTGRREAAQATLQATLVAARKGQLDPSVDLSDTLSVLQESSTYLFASFTDYQRDYWKTYLSIVELEHISGSQLSAAEQTVNLLEQQIIAENAWYEAELERLTKEYEERTEFQVQQLGALLGIDESVLSVGAAISAYQAAVAASNTATETQAATGTAAVSVADYYELKTAQLNAIAEDGRSDWTIEQTVAAFIADGFTSAVTHWEEWGQYEGLPRPSFAVGTDYVPYDMTANIHQGERITPAAYNRSDATNAEIVAMLKEVVASVRDTGTASAKASGKVAAILDTWNYDGIPEERTL